jgi:hypothetical protein
MGLVTAGSGGSAYNYSFDADGLSNDPQLAYNLQSLTPQQLQTALNPDPTGELTYQQTLAVNNQYISSGLNCDGTDCGTTIPNPSLFPSIPTWLWLVGGGVIAFSLLRK